MPAKSITLGNNITELTLLNPIQPERVEQLRAVLLGLQEAIDRGEKTPIQDISTIHYARWAIVENVENVNGPFLLFESNFDGSWEGYLSDFSQKIPEGLDSIWSNCVGFPANGCKDYEAFKQWVAKYQIQVNTYYAAYPDKKVKQVFRAFRVEQLANELLPVAEKFAEAMSE